MNKKTVYKAMIFTEIFHNIFFLKFVLFRILNKLKGINQPIVDC